MKYTRPDPSDLKRGDKVIRCINYTGNPVESSLKNDIRQIKEIKKHGGILIFTDGPPDLWERYIRVEDALKILISYQKEITQKLNNRIKYLNGLSQTTS